MIADLLAGLAKRQRKSVIQLQLAKGAEAHAGCHFWLGAEGRGRDDVCAVMLMKDEEEIIFHNLAWHLRLGFRRFIIADNGSTDRGRAILENARKIKDGALIVIVDDPEPAHYQDRKTTGLARMAQSLWPSVRWVFPIDADEFLCCRDSLDAAVGRLEAAGADIAYVPYYNANELRDGSPCDEARPFYKRQTYHKPRLEDFKVAFKSGEIRMVHNGNHDVAMGGLWHRRVGGLDMGLIYRHFPARSPSHLRRKILNGGRALAATDYSEQIGFHWRHWYARYQAEGEEALVAIYDEMRIPLDGAVSAPFPLDELLDLADPG